MTSLRCLVPLVLALVPVVGRAAPPPRQISASSEGVGDDGAKYLAAHAFDGLLATGWAEGDAGDGVGAWLELRFDKPVDVASISIYPGFLGGSDREIREYGRPKLITVTLQPVTGEAVTK